MPGGDPDSPLARGASELADLGWAVAVAHDLGELIDPLERKVRVVVA